MLFESNSDLDLEAALIEILSDEQSLAATSRPAINRVQKYGMSNVANSYNAFCERQVS